VAAARAPGRHGRAGRRRSGARLGVLGQRLALACTTIEARGAHMHGAVSATSARELPFRVVHIQREP